MNTLIVKNNINERIGITKINSKFNANETINVINNIIYIIIKSELWLSVLGKNNILKRFFTINIVQHA